MRVVPLGQVEAGMESSLAELGEAFDAEIEARRDQFNVPLLQGVVDDAFVLLCQD